MDRNPLSGWSFIESGISQSIHSKNSPFDVPVSDRGTGLQYRVAG